jgi:predicted membrane protein
MPSRSATHARAARGEELEYVLMKLSSPIMKMILFLQQYSHSLSYYSLSYYLSYILSKGVVGNFLFEPAYILASAWKSFHEVSRIIFFVLVAADIIAFFVLIMKEKREDLKKVKYIFTRKKRRLISNGLKEK